MRNLLGRLHARPAPDLARIAAFWRVPLGQGEPAAQVAALYRTMVDPRAARDAWDRLDPARRAVVRLLAVAGERDAALPLAELAARLGVPEVAARETATALYRIGILAREGDDDPLPVGVAPRLFLPRELALLFRRVQDEIEVGDRSGDRLATLLEWLDDGELEEAARRWGVALVPGLRRRQEVARQLLRLLGDPDRIARAVAGLGPDAARLWRRLTAEPEGGPVLLAAAAADVGLGRDDPRTADRLRAALTELEASLLAWHTYTPDGFRWLFVPEEIRAPRPAAPPPLPPLAALPAEAVAPPPWRHPDALAWDLLALVRAAGDPDGPPWPPSGEVPRRVARGLAGRLWFAADAPPPAGYLPFLVALARGEGLLRVDEAAPPPRLRPAAAVRAWRERPFPALSAALRRRWLDAPGWIEGDGEGRVEVRGADWPVARRRLLRHLADPALGIEPGIWYPLDDVAARIAAHDPYLLGSTFVAATARVGGEAGAGVEEAEARRAAIAEAVAVELTGALRWFGLMETAAVPGRTGAIRVTPLGARLAADPEAAVEQAAADSPAPPLAFAADGGIVLREASPGRVWALLAFADPVRLDRDSVFAISPASLARALAAGFDREQVVAFLRRQSRASVPDALGRRLAAWARSYRRVRLRRAVVLLPDDPDERAGLVALLAERGLTIRDGGDGALIVEPPDRAQGGDDALAAILREAGFAPLWSEGRTA